MSEPKPSTGANQFKIGGCSCSTAKIAAEKWFCPTHGQVSRELIEKANLEMGQEFKDAMDRAKPPATLMATNPQLPITTDKSEIGSKANTAEIRRYTKPMNNIGAPVEYQYGEYVLWADLLAALQTEREKLKEYKANNNAAHWNETLGKRMDQIKALESQLHDRDSELIKLREAISGNMETVCALANSCDAYKADVKEKDSRIAEIANASFERIAGLEKELAEAKATIADYENRIIPSWKTEELDWIETDKKQRAEVTKLRTALEGADCFKYITSCQEEKDKGKIVNFCARCKALA